MPALLLLLHPHWSPGLRPARNLQSLILVLTAILGVSLMLFMRDEWRSGIFPDTRGLALSTKFDCAGFWCRPAVLCVRDSR